ncbi:MAG: hypothetical protein ACLR8Y_11895 [Alistipes indistinctus]
MKKIFWNCYAGRRTGEHDRPFTLTGANCSHCTTRGLKASAW